MEKERVKLLFEKYIRKTLTAEEALEFESYIDDPSLEALLRQSVEDTWDNFSESEQADRPALESITKTLEDDVFYRIAELDKKKVKPLSFYWRYAAAVLVLVSALGLLVFKLVTGESKDDFAVNKVITIAPGTNRASLYLADGKEIVLSEKMEGIEVENGLIRYENGATIVGDAKPQELLIAIPRGGKYKLQLADGTKVWLNASSSLRYPSVFSGAERIVEIKGEAYFEVHHDPKHPFLVKSGTQMVRVLGTSFNINTYREDVAITTLVNGKIALHTSKGIEKILLPGEQATNNTNGLSLNKVNVQDYIAWKDDLIVLNNQDLQDVLKQLERWYDVEFVEIDLIPVRKTLSGEIPRNTNLSTILQALEEQANISFEIKGRRIMVRN